MTDMIQWLRNIERLACQVYRQAALVYSDDSHLSSLLEHLAEEEAYHYNVMASAVNYLEKKPHFIPAISVDKETGDNITHYFLDIQNGLENQSMSKSELLEKIVEAELSEWNDIFFYIVNSLKEKTDEFKYPAARMQTHIKKIEHYLESVDNSSEILKKIAHLPPVWVEKILIVEDNQMIANLIRSLLNREGDIDITHNGEDALKMIEEKFYKLIISDIDMPIMDGISLYKKAVAKFPNLKTRFLFMTGDLSPGRKRFFNSNNIECLSKPMEIKKLQEITSNMLLSN